MKSWIAIALSATAVGISLYGYNETIILTERVDHLYNIQIELGNNLNTRIDQLYETVKDGYNATVETGEQIIETVKDKVTDTYNWTIDQFK